MGIGIESFLNYPIFSVITNMSCIMIMVLESVRSPIQVRWSYLVVNLTLNSFVTQAKVRCAKCFAIRVDQGSRSGPSVITPRPPPFVLLVFRYGISLIMNDAI